ncbi:MAG TPA: 4'-phosphopantetheinyl transferase superfamily protein [Pedobacter sp.]|jgi:4'-phosphopantetheinyl transferase EntD
MFLFQEEPFQSFFTCNFFSDKVLTQNEHALISNWSSKRVTEFSTGRYCARKTLKSLGLTEPDILIGETREPLWPEGITGSISHCNNLVGAVTASTTKVKALGLDIEIIGKVGLEIWDLVFTDNEQEFLRRNHTQDSELYSTVIFSAKECFYKLQFPITKTYIDFKDVEILINGEELKLSFVKHFEDISFTFEHVIIKYLTYNSNVITYGYLLDLNYHY